MVSMIMRYHYTADWLCRQITWAVLQIMDRRTAEVLATVFGLWLTVMPLTLWFAWSKEVFGYILLSGAISCALFTLLGIAISPEGKSNGFEDWKRLVKAYDRERSSEKQPGWRDVA